MKKIKNIVLIIVIWSSCFAILINNQDSRLEYNDLKGLCLENNTNLVNLSPGFFSYSGYEHTYLQVISRYVIGSSEILSIEVSNEKKIIFEFFIIKEKECKTFLI